MARNNENRLKVQANLEAFPAWAIQRLLELGTQKNSELTKRIVQDWLTLKQDELAKMWGISMDAYSRASGSNVTSIDARREARQIDVAEGD